MSTGTVTGATMQLKRLAFIQAGVQQQQQHHHHHEASDSLTVAAPTAAQTATQTAVTDASTFFELDGTSELSSIELAEYEAAGLVVPRCKFTAVAVASLQQLTAATLAVTCSADPPVDMPVHSKRNALGKATGRTHRLNTSVLPLLCSDQVGPHCPTSLYGAHGPPIPEHVASGWMGLARHPQLLDQVEAVLGKDLILWGAQLFHKPPFTGLEVPWHQDGR